MKWKWDGGHAAIAGAYALGFLTIVAPTFKHLDVTTACGDVALLAGAVCAFFKSTPKDLGHAFAQGEAEGKGGAS